MSCPIYSDSPDLLMDFAAGKLEWDASQKMLGHIAVCSECKAGVEAQTTVWKALDEWDAVPVSRDFDARLYERIEKEQSTVWGRLKHWLVPQGGGFGWRPAMGMAAVTVIFLGGSLLKVPSSPDMSTNMPVRMEAQEIEQAERALEDVEMVDSLMAEAPKSESQAL